MKIATKMNGFSMAAAAATMFLAAPLAAVADTPTSMGHCMGANACKGQSACKTVSNACKGQNACKGKGFVAESKDSCDKAGGKYEASKNLSSSPQ